LLLEDVPEIAFSIHMFAHERRDQEQLSWASFDESHISKLLATLKETSDQCSLAALMDICNRRPDLKAEVKSKLFETTAFLYAVLQAYVYESREGVVFPKLEECLKLSASDRAAQPLGLLAVFELDWRDHKGLLGRLFEARDGVLTKALLSHLRRG